jgi:hypothetical protein
MNTYTWLMGVKARKDDGDFGPDMHVMVEAESFAAAAEAACAAVGGTTQTHAARNIDASLWHGVAGAYTRDTELRPGDILASRHAGVTDPMVVADPAYDERGRVVILNPSAGRVLGNRNRAPRLTRYKRKSPILLGRTVVR